MAELDLDRMLICVARGRISFEEFVDREDVDRDDLPRARAAWRSFESQRDAGITLMPLQDW